MSTLDTLVAAVSALVVNDIWRTFSPGREDAYYLRVARRAAIVSTVVGLFLIPVFSQFQTVHQALLAIIGVSTPPLMVVILLGVLWPRFTARAAFWTLILGSAAILASLFYPQLIAPLAHGVELSEAKPYVYMRNLFGLLVSVLLGVGITLFDRRGLKETRPGLVLSTLDEGIAKFKGGKPNYRAPGRSAVLPLTVTASESTEVRLPQRVLDELDAEPGDLLYVSDSRWWLGGLRSVHVKAGPVAETDDAVVLSQRVLEEGHLLADRPVRVEKII